jgi:hypothetical protein
MLENPRREVSLKRNNNKVIDASRRRSRPQSLGQANINKEVASSFVYTLTHSQQLVRKSKEQQLQQLVRKSKEQQLQQKRAQVWREY